MERIDTLCTSGCEHQHPYHTHCVDCLALLRPIGGRNADGKFTVAYFQDAAQRFAFKCGYCQKYVCYTCFEKNDGYCRPCSTFMFYANGIRGGYAGFRGVGADRELISWVDCAKARAAMDSVIAGTLTSMDDLSFSGMPRSNDVARLESPVAPASTSQFDDVPPLSAAIVAAVIVGFLLARVLFQ